MGRIFISHRSADYAESVAPLHGRLVAAYGETNVILDKTHFVPGEDWLPQILSSVATTDIIILALTPSWRSRSPRPSQTDYLIEELRLAKKLRKTILPVLIGVTPEEVRASMPLDLAWITDLQFLPNSPDDTVLQGALHTKGFRPEPGATLRNRKYPTIGNGSIAIRAAVNLLGSCLFPTSCASLSLQPNGARLQESVLEAFYVAALMCISTLLATGNLSAYQAARLAMGVVAGTAIIFALVQLLTVLGKRRPSVVSLFSHALHTASATAFVFVIWILGYWVVLPDDIQVYVYQLLSMPKLNADAAEQFFNRLSTANTIVLTVIQWGAILHAAYVVRGSFIAGVVAVGWRRWQAVSIIAVTFISLLMAWLILTSIEF